MATAANQRSGLENGLDLSQSLLLDQEVIHLETHRDTFRPGQRSLHNSSQQFTRVHKSSQDFNTTPADHDLISCIYT